MTIARARLLVELARWPEALEELGPELADPSAGTGPWCVLAQIRIGQGKRREAQDAAERAIAADPDCELAHRLRAIALLGRRRGAEAERSARRSVELEPTLSLSLYVLTEVLRARNRLRPAADVARRNLEANPNSVLAWQSAARLELRRRNWARAEEFARRGLALAPDDADLLLHLSRATARQGRAGEAAQQAASAIRARPQDPRGRRQLDRSLTPMIGFAATFVILQLGRLLLISFHGDAASHRVGNLVWHLLQGLLGAALLLLIAARVQSARQLTRSLPPELRAYRRRQRKRGAGLPLLVLGAISGFFWLVELPQIPVAAGLGLAISVALVWAGRRIRRIRV